MAFVKQCSVCRCINPPGAQRCECKASLADIMPVEESSLQPSGPALELEFPFGLRRIAADTLLGRDNADFGEEIEASANGGYVSHEHAVIVVRDGRFFIQHVGREDRNRTYLDGRAIEGETELRDGQRLSLSLNYHIQVRISA